MTRYMYPLSTGFETPAVYGPEFNEGMNCYRFAKSAATWRYFSSLDITIISYVEYEKEWV